MPQVITTARLSLAVLEPAHVNDVHALFSAPGHTVGDGPVTDIGDTLRWIKRRQEVYADRGWAWYGLWVSGQQFVGTCGLLQAGRCGADPEIGYEVAASSRGLGYAKEAAQVVTEAAGQAGVRCVWATLRPTNKASQQIVQALGYDFVRTVPDGKGALDFYRMTISGS